MLHLDGRSAARVSQRAGFVGDGASQKHFNEGDDMYEVKDDSAVGVKRNVKQ